MAAVSAVLVVQGISILRDESLGFAWRTVEAMFVFLLAVVGSPLYPLLGFKSDERTLESAASGWS